MSCELRTARCIAIICLLVLILVGCGLREERAIYREAALWIEAYALPSERIAVRETATRFFSNRDVITCDVVALPEDGDAFSLLATVQDARPDFVVAWPSVAWDGVRAQPWFQSHYRLLDEMAIPSQPQIALDIFAYTPSPFDAGDVVLVELPLREDCGLELQAVRVSQPRLTPGASLHVTLFWDGDFPVWFDGGRLVLRLVSDVDALPEDARPLIQLEEMLVDGHPQNLFRDGDGVFSQYTLGVPDDLPEGVYRLTLALDSPNGAPLLDEDFMLAQFAHFAVTRDAPAMDFVVDWRLGDAIALVGYDAPERVAPGDVLRVALYWHALDTVPANYTAFVHVMDTGGNLVAQSDAVPVNWTYATAQWQVGEYVRDEHVLTLDAALLGNQGLSRGDYTLFVGLYDAGTGTRLDVSNPDGQSVPENLIELRVVKVRW